MLRRLIYISRSLDCSPEVADEIVTSSIANNDRAGVTGMLWASRTHFAQVLEGEADDVGSLMNRIQADGRHTDIEVIDDRTIASRQFGTWAMRAASDRDCIQGTAFLVGLSLQASSEPARRLYAIVLEVEKLIEPGAVEQL